MLYQYKCRSPHTCALLFIEFLLTNYEGQAWAYSSTERVTCIESPSTLNRFGYPERFCEKMRCSSVEDLDWVSGIKLKSRIFAIETGFIFITCGGNVDTRGTDKFKKYKYVEGNFLDLFISNYSVFLKMAYGHFVAKTPQIKTFFRIRSHQIPRRHSSALENEPGHGILD